METIFNYTDYRKYLKDFYDDQKRMKSFFSYNYFAQKSGYKTKAALFKVMNGDRGLSAESILRIAKVMGLKEKETKYFENLVRFNDAKTVSQREYYFDQIKTCNKTSAAFKIKDNQFEYFSHWHNVVIRELVNIMDFDDDFKLLANKVNPHITPKQAKDSIHLLIELGLIKRIGKGKYKQVDKSISTGDEVSSLAIQKYQIANLNLAAEAIDRYPREMRNIATITASVSKKGFETIKKDINDFCKHLTNVIEKDEPADRVYQINFQLFPLTTISKE